jgi:hypothetical protein
MKYKLPERFKITRIEGETRLWITDQIKNEHDTCETLKEASEKIERYLRALEIIENTELANGYKIVTNCIDYKFTLINSKGIFVSNSNSFEKLLQEAIKTTELDLQITALNNGEEIEL